MNYENHNPESSLLLGEIRSDAKITDRKIAPLKKLSEKIEPITLF